MSNYHNELSLATELAKNASKITEWFRKIGFETYQKSDKSPVTLADIATQIYITSHIKEIFPNDQIIAEEDGSFLDKKAEKLILSCFKDIIHDHITNLKELVEYKGKKSNRQWSVDPIDGTKGFSKGLCYSIGIGFMDKSDTKVCAICVPNYNKKSLAIFSAEKGEGAWVRTESRIFNKIKVSSKTNIKQAKLVHSLHYDEQWVTKFINVVGLKDAYQVDSMVKFCKVADASADFYLKPIDHHHSYSWDYCPGDLLVKEAGGKVTDLNGKELIYQDEHLLCSTYGFLASNGILHEEILDLINEKILVSQF